MFKYISFFHRSFQKTETKHGASAGKEIWTDMHRYAYNINKKPSS